jgi:hypothetical protein
VNFGDLSSPRNISTIPYPVLLLQERPSYTTTSALIISSIVVHGVVVKDFFGLGLGCGRSIGIHGSGLSKAERLSVGLHLTS